MDVDAVIRRAPELALVDELAHTNAPGSRNEKRYQDIDEILDAGIDVISTVNIQHLESLNDAVFELTGVRVRETFPDRMLDEADEVILVDISPEALQDRLRAGKVYPGGQAERALLNFFRQDNLSALRELALREVAEDVEASPRLDRARPAEQAGGRRARPRTRRAAAALPARAPSCVEVVSAPRRRDRRPLDAATGAAARRGGGDAARCAATTRLDSRRPLPRGGGDRPRGDDTPGCEPSAARRTSSSARPTSAAGSRSRAGRSSRG